MEARVHPKQRGAPSNPLHRLRLTDRPWVTRAGSAAASEPCAGRRVAHSAAAERALGPGGAARQGEAAALPRMKRRDFSLEQLREFDGARNPRILLAVNGKVFDVTKGSKFYGPEGPYGIFAGRDASRGLATFCLDKDALRDEYDDLSDLNAVQMESVREWEMQFKEKYDYVGRLLKPGEEPSEYTDEEDTKDHTKQE
uniref:Progesterone receptor membrane component 2 n=1 Tax=Cyanistes caeruleus TaxID=156563 RepID=A0A8C0U240_CYACU